jgi:RNA polymerase sigma factor (sigma-70 family)
MATSMTDFLQHLRQSTLQREGEELTDGQLLESFVSRCEAAALEVLVRRHAPMVWCVCLRVLGNTHDAEDAFQAAFLVLVRLASCVGPRGQLGAWLHGVAQKTALKARAVRLRRKRRERQVEAPPEPAVMDQDHDSELRALLDLELSRLPEKYRAAIVLCDLEGRSRSEAARSLGCPEGTLAGRLARARVMLARRLSRHGLAVTGAALAAVCPPGRCRPCRLRSCLPRSRRRPWLRQGKRRLPRGPPPRSPP